MSGDRWTVEALTAAGAAGREGRQPARPAVTTLRRSLTPAGRPGSVTATCRHQDRHRPLPLPRPTTVTVISGRDSGDVPGAMAAFETRRRRRRGGGDSGAALPQASTTAAVAVACPPPQRLSRRPVCLLTQAFSPQPRADSSLRHVSSSWPYHKLLTTNDRYNGPSIHS